MDGGADSLRELGGYGRQRVTSVREAETRLLKLSRVKVQAEKLPSVGGC